MVGILISDRKKLFHIQFPHQLEQDAAWRNRIVLLKKRRTRERKPQGSPWLRRSWQEGAWVGRGGTGGDELRDLRRLNS